MTSSAQPQSLGSWVIISSDGLSPRRLYIEPFVVGWYMEKGQNYYVYICEGSEHLPEIVFSGDAVQVFASLAVVYRDGEEIWNYGELQVDPPPQALRRP